MARRTAAHRHASRRHHHARTLATHPIHRDNAVEARPHAAPQATWTAIRVLAQPDLARGGECGSNCLTSKCRDRTAIKRERHLRRGTQVRVGQTHGRIVPAPGWGGKPVPLAKGRRGMCCSNDACGNRG